MPIGGLGGDFGRMWGSRGGVTAAAFTPASLSPVRWGEVAMGGLFQSNAGTTSAASNGDPVGYYPDHGTGAKHLTSAADDTTRPTLQGVGVKPYLSFDGANDLLRYIGGTGIGAYAAGSASWFVAFRASSPATSSIFLDEGGGTTGSAYGLMATGSGAGTTLSAYIRNDAGTVLVTTTSTILSNIFDGNDHVLGMIDNGTTITPYIDGIAGAAFTYTARTGTFTIDRLTIGALLRTSASSWWSGRIYGEVLVNRVLTSTEIANLTTYLTNLYKVSNVSNSLVANRTQVPTSFAAIAQNTTSKRTHYAHPDAAIVTIQTVDVGWRLSSAGISNADSRTIKRYIEYPANTFTQITWDGGSSSKTIAAGAVVVSDPITLAIPAGSQFWERTVNLNASVTNFPVIDLPANATTLGVDDGNDATDKGNSGTISASASTQFFGAASIIGTLSASGARSFVLVGDSICFGTGDASSAGAVGGSGYVARSLDVHGYPYTKIACSSLRGSLYVGVMTPIQALLNAINFSDAIVELGVNDLTNGDSVTTILFNHQRVYQQIGFYGASIKQATITPISSSTDSWATTANQTASSTGNMGNINTLNSSIRAVPSQLSGILEVADAAMSARDSKIWSAPPAATSDGTHPNSTKHASIATAISGSI